MQTSRRSVCLGSRPALLSKLQPRLACRECYHLSCNWCSPNGASLVGMPSRVAMVVSLCVLDISVVTSCRARQMTTRSPRHRLAWKFTQPCQQHFHSYLVCCAHLGHALSA